MTATDGKAVRCAIYTRVSTDAGLDQDFNSLDAQYEAAQAYIKSQAHAGWALVRTRYDDGGFSGGSTDRPALQQLLEDVKAHKVKIIVVYKVDRLTRSLADFAKLVELFDAHGVSFVSVTQQFNTTTSMGRLTLNVLLSFAQFEREVTSERIRDKIGASKRKGLWVGGVVPMGYHAKDRKISVVENEAKVVRHIFRRYLELGSLNLLLADLNATGVITKVRPLSTGRTIGGIPFTRGPLAHFLRNRFYVGEVQFKGEVFPGEQPAILDRKLFDTVQARLEQQRNHHTTTRSSTDSLLMGRIYDDRGNRMTPTYATKNGVRYRYYISSSLVQSGSDKPRKLNRLPAAEIETLIASAVRKHLGIAPFEAKEENDDDKEVITSNVARVDVRPDHLEVQLSTTSQGEGGSDLSSDYDGVASEGKSRKRKGQDLDKATILTIAWKKTPSKKPRELIPPTSATSRSDPRPIRAETRTKLIAAIAKGRQWLDELIASDVTNVEQIAVREVCTIRQVNMTISLAFLGPDLVNAAIEGRLPRGVGVANLRDAPLLWSEQSAMLGLAPRG
ncbi:MAG: recombinase family protein [Pseudolabrys sp.]|nr:recombinase family protein [Pseudolabrys sp.]